MKPSQKTDYALRAMLDLAVNVPPGRLARTPEIARRTGMPAKFLEAILAELRRAGLVDSQRGPAGGHRLARGPDVIRAGDVWRAIEGPIALGERASRRRAGADPGARAIHQLWQDVAGAAERAVDGVTLEDLARRAQAASGVNDFTI